MAFCASQLREVFKGEEGNFDTIMELLMARSIVEVIDVACLEEEDMQAILGDRTDLTTTAYKLMEAAQQYKDGRAGLACLESRAKTSAIEYCDVPSQPPPPPPAPSAPFG